MVTNDNIVMILSSFYLTIKFTKEFVIYFCIKDE